MCWLCSQSYKRALVRTKQSDPTRHSRVFKADKEKKEKEKRYVDPSKQILFYFHEFWYFFRDKYFNHKKPQRPDVTKMKQPNRRSSSEEPLAKIAKKRDRESDTDHVAEITQLKEKIAAQNRTITSKNNELLGKAGEITAMRAKLFREETTIKERMKKMEKAHSDKVNDLNAKINQLQTELSKARREANAKAKIATKKAELFPGANKKDLISTADLRPKRTESPAATGTAQSSRSQSPSPSRSNSSRSRSRSRSPEKSMKAAKKNNNSSSRSVSRSPTSRSRSRSASPKRSPRSVSRSRSRSPPREKSVEKDSNSD